ncbi:cation diffusion facilitator family transporter [uncultured Desulfovibrio sp.]|uniref:cation diffusion facilitator family transporter n=1 Tax=uncultured Desulfovibrio sp. TaxID=167968 RepID=UPI00261DCA54|nr:cation diffusion facilitator family transporter [uncultured Desulfovibrio sp.]
METPGHDDGAAEKHRAALVSLFAALVLTALKLAVGLYTNSLGILSEALHSGLDLLAAAMTLAAVRISARPADSCHPYGHGKVENLSALAETLLLFLTCFWVVYEGAQRLLDGVSPVAPSLWGVAVMAVSMGIDINRVRILRKVARQYKSQALEADALHFSTDILSSGVVLVGVLAVWMAAALNLPEPLYRVLAQADTVAALVVALIIFRASLRMAVESINILMDSGSTREQAEVIKAVWDVPGIKAVRRVRLRSSGPQTFVDLTIGVEPGIRVRDGHRLAHEAEQVVAAILPGADVTVHVEPQSTPCEKEDNPFSLVQRTASEHGLAVHNVHVLRAGGLFHIELHVELPGALPYAEAYARVGPFEDDLRQALPGVEVVTHLEPEGAASALQAGAAVSMPLAELAWREVRMAVEKEPLLCDPHRFSTYELPEQGICISFHCGISGKLSVEEVHNICVRLEKRLRGAVPPLGRIIVHVEPDAVIAEQR